MASLSVPVVCVCVCVCACGVCACDVCVVCVCVCVRCVCVCVRVVCVCVCVCALLYIDAPVSVWVSVELRPQQCPRYVSYLIIVQSSVCVYIVDLHLACHSSCLCIHVYMALPVCTYPYS